MDHGLIDYFSLRFRLELCVGRNQRLGSLPVRARRHSRLGEVASGVHGDCALWQASSSRPLRYPRSQPVQYAGVTSFDTWRVGLSFVPGHGVLLPLTSLKSAGGRQSSSNVAYPLSFTCLYYLCHYFSAGRTLIALVEESRYIQCFHVLFRNGDFSLQGMV